MNPLGTSPHKYQDIFNRILERIENGELKPGDRLPGVRALGEEYGCNYHTVRHAFEELAIQGYVELKRGSGTFITDSTENLKNQQNNVKSAQKTEKVGIILPLRTWGHYVTRLIDHLQQSADEMGINLDIRTVSAIDIHSAELAHDFKDKNCCAVILPWLGDDQNLAHLHDFVHASNLPVVLADPISGLEEYCYLDPKVDLELTHSTTYLQCSYFKTIGYKKVALLGPNTMGADYWQRNLMLYSQWCNLEDFPGLVGMVDHTPEDYERIVAYWKPHIGEIAIIAYHDEIALGFMQACKDGGFSVPEDFAVLGHNNNPLGLRSDPPLSTLLCPYRYVSNGLLNHAVALSKGLSNQLSGHEPQDFFIRESCGGRMKYGDQIEDIVSALLAQTREPSVPPLAALETEKMPSSLASGQ